MDIGMEGANPLAPNTQQPQVGHPHRKPLPHHPPVQRWNEPVVLFVTLCVSEDSFTLTSPAIQAALVQSWHEATHWRVGTYIIMPDHVHLFCIPAVPDPASVVMWNKFWKGRLRRILGLNRSVWQQECWDTQMRSREHYTEKLSYVRNNPVRRGLVRNAEDWPYQGELYPIAW